MTMTHLHHLSSASSSAEHRLLRFATPPAPAETPEQLVEKMEKRTPEELRLMGIKGIRLELEKHDKTQAHSVGAAALPASLLRRP